MPRTVPWFSLKADVYHNNSKCKAGRNIEPRNLRTGTGGKLLCKECRNLNAAGK